MNMLVVIIYVFIAGCIQDLCKYLFYALCWLFLGWPDEVVFKVLDVNFAFSIFCLLVFSLPPIFCPVLDELVFQAIDALLAQLYSSAFYRQLM
nr:ORF8 [Bat coronavirus]